MQELLESLVQQYLDAGFSHVGADDFLSSAKDYPFIHKNLSDLLIFKKDYQFKDSDGADKVVAIHVSYSKEYPLIPPVLIDPENILSSMHSLNGFQCWARYSDIFPQIGLGLIVPSFVENQIEKLIAAHISREYYTVNESPEFAATFEKRDAVDRTQFYVNIDVLEQVVSAGPGKVICGEADYLPGSKLYGVIREPLIYAADTHIYVPGDYEGKKRKVYFLNVSRFIHYDFRSDDEQFIYYLERLAGVDVSHTYLTNIKEEVFVCVTFFNKHIQHHDIVVFRKNGTKLTLLPHARVSSRLVLLNRHIKEASKLANNKIALMGIGAIGSVLGMNLLQSGAEHLSIIDNDYVELENISRSIYDSEDIGMLKTDAFIRHATRKEFDFNHRIKVMKTYDEILEDKPNLFIVCIGSLYDEYLISRTLRAKGFDNIVFVFGQNDCTWGGVYFQDDAELGCQQCLFLHQNENQELKIPYYPYFAEAVGCGNPSYVSGPSDIGLLANIASKLIIERFSNRKRRGHNFYIWQSNPEPHALKDSHTDQFSLKKYRIEKHVSCAC